MRYFRNAVTHDYGHHVEAKFAESRAAVGQPLGSQTMQPLLLAPVNGLRRFSPARRMARLHLTEDHQWPPRGHDVDLAETTLIVLLENGEPLILEVLDGEAFTHASEAGASVHATQARECLRQNC
jgi:hypothetical protein